MNEYLHEQTRLYLAKLNGRSSATDDAQPSSARRIRWFNLRAWLSRQQPAPHDGERPPQHTRRTV